MEERNKPENVSYVVYSDTVADYQWIIKKLVIALVVSTLLGLVCTVGSNMAWLYVWQQYDYSSEETVVESDGNSIANFTGGDGGVNYVGTSDGEEDNEDEA